MDLFAPRYYQNFTCIADRCKHSCCVGWEIDVDEDTLKLYQNSSHPYAEKILESIDPHDTPHFCLGEGERCPHLNERGLCRIILSLGEDALCDICREHPRFYHETSHGMEVGLGMACEEACRLILTSDGYAEMILVDELDGMVEPLDFDAVEGREGLYQILSDPALTYAEKRQRIANSHHVSLKNHTNEVWRELLGSLEYLDEHHRELFSQFSLDTAAEPALEATLTRALAYFIFRHCSDACDEEAFRRGLGFALFCEQLLISLTQGTHQNDVSDLARTVSEELEYSEDNTDAIKCFFDV